ncbi:ribosome hibernation promoting factor [Cognaticolwellia aestuarii]|uniref:ribosome hibernation promoting factor n=1 Tax=Cognaticolwellia aestuarii TaxID=329993 RepID=UPI000984E234|nr:ribosome hibernation promoting factor [Cognaticolwellia aestuarii]
MQINLTGHHVDVTDSLRDYVNGKFEKLERHFDHINNVHVVLTVEKLNQIAESTVHLTGTEVHAKAENSDMYASIDALIDKLDRQILKYKGKINKH